MSNNLQGDARANAAKVIDQLQRTRFENSFYCYGTHHSVLIGIGRKSSLKLAKADTLDAVWSGINEYIETNISEYIFGFIGFDPANQLNKEIKHPQQKIDLFTAVTVIECTPEGCSVISGALDKQNIQLNTSEQHKQLNNIKPLNIHQLDNVKLRNKYASSVADFIMAIEAGKLERATLARKIDSPCEFDLAKTFTADHSQHELARSFYFSSEHISFAGQSPELLAEGNKQLFATHKLSGTYAKDKNLPVEELSLRFINDQRIISEHQSSLAAIECSLAIIGNVDSTKFQVMELPTLLHGWSKFSTRPKQGTTIASCLRSIFPFGVNPVEQGFELLAKHENFNRGPYYGLTGYIQPDGEFSFTQVLRSAFIDRNSSYLMAGAAITSLSTAELEAAETCTKLLGVQVFERNSNQN